MDLAQAGPSEPQPNPKISCTFCRRRKLKCSRELPKCNSCLKFGFDCEYAPGLLAGGSRSDSKSSRVRQLEDRLGRVEQLLHSRQKQETTSTSKPSTSSKETSVEDFTDDASLGPDDMKLLDEKYFEFIHPSVNIIHQNTYYERLKDSQLRLPIYLRQAMWALAASTSTVHADRCESFYQSSRKHLEEAELKSFDMDSMPLFPAQTWTLISIFELNRGYFHRAFMSTSRAVRLVQMMRLHRLDGVTHSSDPTRRLLAPLNDVPDAEERRRVFWMAYVMDRASCISMGFPSLIDERDIRTLLPVSNHSFELSTAEQSCFLSDALTNNGIQLLSPFAAMVVILSLSGAKLAELQRYDPNASPIQSTEKSVWLKPQRLGGAFATEFLVPEHLSIPSAQLDPNTAILNMGAHALTIAVHRAAQAQVGQEYVPGDMLSTSMKLCLGAASHVMTVMKATSHWDVSSFHPWTAYTLFLAAGAFAKAWLAERNPDHEAALKFLLESLRAFKKTTILATIMLSDLNIEFPTLLGQLDRTLADSIRNDVLMFSHACMPEQQQTIKVVPEPSIGYELEFPTETTEGSDFEDFDISQDVPDLWDFGASPFGLL